MKFWELGVLCGATCIHASVAASDLSWAVKWQQPVEGRLADVYGPYAFIVGRQTTRLVSVDKLDAEGVARVGDFVLARDQVPASTWATSTSPVVKSLRGRMQRLAGDKLENHDPATELEPHFFLVYFSAHWCGPCRRFTPGLVADYQRLQEKYPGKFELIFMSSDESAGAQQKYAREASMPWPMVKYSAVRSVKPLARWAGAGVPCLVLLSRDGDLIAHSYRGKEYVGPSEVWTQFERLMALAHDDNVESRRIMHPIALRRHIAAAGTGSRPAKPYVIAVDPKPYRALKLPAVTVVASVDARGTTRSITTEPELPSLDANYLAREADSWLFLPAIADGKPTDATVRFELKL